MVVQILPAALVAQIGTNVTYEQRASTGWVSLVATNAFRLGAPDSAGSGFSNKQYKLDLINTTILV